MYFILPELKGHERVKANRGMWSFWLMSVGMLGMIASLTFAGVIQVYLHRVLGMDFIKVRDSYLRIWLLFRWLFGLAVILPGAVERRKTIIRGGAAMFVNFIFFPPIKKGKEAEFREWFQWYSREYAKHQGLIRRRLLKPEGGWNYESFMPMRTSATQKQAHERVVPLLDGNTVPHFY